MLHLLDFCSKKTLQTFLGFFLKPTTGGLNPQVPQTIDDLVTPCYIGYLPVIQRNCERMLQRAHSLGCQLRPHMKTHKTIQGTWDKEGGNWWDVCFVKRGRIMSLEIWLNLSKFIPVFFFKDLVWRCRYRFGSIFLYQQKKSPGQVACCPFSCHRPKGGILATGGSKRCITVSTLAEAEFYADAGFEVHVTFCLVRIEKGVKGGMGDIKINMSMPSMFVFSINIVEDCWCYSQCKL